MKFNELAIGKTFKGGDWYCFITNIVSGGYNAILVNVENYSIALDFIDFDTLEDYDIITKEEFNEKFENLINILTDYLKLNK